MIGFKLKNIEKKFDSLEVFKKINLEVEPGSFVSVVGPSGCGKSTLLRLIAELENPTQGQIEFSKNNPRRALVFQEANLLPWRNALENIQLPFELDKTLPRKSARQESTKALCAVNLEKFGQNFPHQLSGGMKMRVSLARALVSYPELLLLDEPFSALDENIRHDLQIQLLELWAVKKFTVLLVTHSISEAVFLSQKVLILKNGRIQDEKNISFPSRNQKLKTSLEFNQCLQEIQALQLQGLNDA